MHRKLSQRRRTTPALSSVLLTLPRAGWALLVAIAIASAGWAGPARPYDDRHASAGAGSGGGVLSFKSGARSAISIYGGRWFRQLSEIQGVDELLDARSAPRTYSPSHRATLVSWARYFDDVQPPADVPVSGSDMTPTTPPDVDGGDDSDAPGPQIGPDIPPVPSPDSAALGIAAVLVGVCLRRR